MKNLSTIKNKTILTYLCACSLLIASVILGVLSGAYSVSFSKALEVLLGLNANTPEARIILYVRLPRILASLVCGAALSVSGAVVQSVLDNRLASPSIIGVNSGAGLAVAICSAMGIIGTWRLSLSAFIGAFTSAMLVSIAVRKRGSSGGTVILMGVALNSLLGAISDTIITISPDVSIITNDFKVGDFSAVTYTKLIPVSIIVCISLLLLFTLSNQLDVIGLGEENATGLGLNVKAMRVCFLALASLLAGSAVSIAGQLSFVGLLVPHTVRRVCKSLSSCHTLPLCALFGGGFVALCDTLSRIKFSPYEIPVGIIMAFLGAPFFIFILFKSKGGHGGA